MFIHIGNREIVSGTKIIGVFNADTLRKSNIDNEITKIAQKTECDIKTIIVDINGICILSTLQSYTLIKRAVHEKEDYFWSKRR